MSLAFHEINWDLIMKDYKKYKGTKVNFCKENNIKIHQLDYYIKKSKKNSEIIFQPIDITTTTVSECREPTSNNASSTEVRIEIGETKVYVQSSEAELILNILKEINKLC